MTEICVKENQTRGQKLRYRSNLLAHKNKKIFETETFASFKQCNDLKTTLTVSLSAPLLQN